MSDEQSVDIQTKIKETFQGIYDFFGGDTGKNISDWLSEDMGWGGAGGIFAMIKGWLENLKDKIPFLNSEETPAGNSSETSTEQQPTSQEIEDHNYAFIQGMKNSELVKNSPEILKNVENLSVSIKSHFDQVEWKGFSEEDIKAVKVTLSDEFKTTVENSTDKETITAAYDAELKSQITEIFNRNKDKPIIQLAELKSLNTQSNELTNNKIAQLEQGPQGQ